MLVNVVVAAWIIGSITLLIVKGDEKTGEYRDSLQTLQQYGEMNHFDEEFLKKLKSQLRLEHNNREISDEQVLKHFPSALRRKILRKLYLKTLVKTKLMVDVRPQFVDAFLASCTVEIFSPGEEIVERGAILSDLFLLVGGVAAITTPEHIRHGGMAANRYKPLQSYDSFMQEDFATDRELEAGEFIGDIGFFTESPQVDSVASLTVCKTLTISQAAYKLLAQDHPGSVGKILNNLLKTVQGMQVVLPKNLPILRVGSVYDTNQSFDFEFDLESGEADSDPDLNNPSARFQSRSDALTAVADLVKMHMDKQLDDQTTRLLFAASRGDTATISLMCDQGFDPNNADYDRRTALMVAAMKGNTDVVRLLLEYNVSKLRHSPFSLLLKRVSIIVLTHRLTSLCARPIPIWRICMVPQLY
jgi:CRP-like cAMP-binding protein